MTTRTPTRTTDRSTIPRDTEAREFWLGLARDIAALGSICLFILAVPMLAAGFVG